MGSFNQNKACIIGGDQWKTDREEPTGRGAKMMGVEETDMEVLISEVVPHPDPGWQYVSQAGGVFQVRNGGGGSRATTTEASSRVDDACTSLGNADSSRVSLAVEAEFDAKLTGSESRVDVALKDEFSWWVWWGVWEAGLCWRRFWLKYLTSR